MLEAPNKTLNDDLGTKQIESCFDTEESFSSSSSIPSLFYSAEIYWASAWSSDANETDFIEETPYLCSHYVPLFVFK